MKEISVFICQQCGAQYPKWLGKCSACGGWSTLVEEKIHKQTKVSKSSPVEALPLNEISEISEKRTNTGINEFNRVLGGGIVNGSLVLVGGEPGIGKSTLLLQIAGSYAVQKNKVLYISGEESGSQIKLRANRLDIETSEILILTEIDLYKIETAIKKIKPSLVIIDSIQTIHHPDFNSAPGSVGQVRESAARFQVLAKNLNIPIFLVGHVTKEGTIAGPRVLEHIVDTVLYFEGDSHHSYRILRTIKNRFGASNEVAIFAMHGKGLEQIKNPSEVFLSGRMEGVCGAVTVCVMEGTRPLLIELQALVGKSHYGMPQRVTSGVDQRRLSLLVAVMEKNENIPLGINDIFLNVAGGIKANEPGIDLGIIYAVASSFFNIPVSDNIVVMGEIGLGGEVRPVSNLEERLKEITRLGLTECIIPAKSGIDNNKFSELKITHINTIHDVVSFFQKQK